MLSPSQRQAGGPCCAHPPAAVTARWQHPNGLTRWQRPDGLAPHAARGALLQRAPDTGRPCAVQQPMRGLHAHSGVQLC